MNTRSENRRVLNAMFIGNVAGCFEGAGVAVLIAGGDVWIAWALWMAGAVPYCALYGILWASGSEAGER